MLIAAIVVLILNVLLYGILVAYFALDKSKRKYELKTKLPSFLKLLMHVLYFLFGIGFSILAVAVITQTGEKSNNIPFVIIAACFGVFGLFMLFLLESQFEAIDGNRLYLRRFIAIKEIAIDDIRTIDDIGSGYQISTKNGLAFSIAKIGSGPNELVELIKERKSTSSFSLAPGSKDFPSQTDAMTEEEKEKYADIGRRFREAFPKYRKTQLSVLIVISASVTLSAFLVGLLGYIFTKKPVFVFALLSPLVFVFLFLIIFSISKSHLDGELDHDDVWLGYKHRFEDKLVKGCAKRKFALAVGLELTLFACSLLVGLISGFAGGFVDPIPQDSLVTINGELEYFRTISERFSDSYAIGLKGDETEYRIDSLYVPYFDVSFKTEVSAGSIVSIWVDPNHESYTISYEGRTASVHAYGVVTGEKEYFSYAGYLTAFEKNKAGSMGMFIGGMAIAGGSAAGVCASFVAFRRRAKQESIDV